VANSCEYGNQGSIKGAEFLDQLSDYQIINVFCSIELVFNGAF